MGEWEIVQTTMGDSADDDGRMGDSADDDWRMGDSADDDGRMGDSADHDGRMGDSADDDGRWKAYNEALQFQKLKALHERLNTEESRTIQNLCLGASYVVCWKLAKALKPFTDGELVKRCMVPEQNIVNYISLLERLKCEFTIHRFSDFRRMESDINLFVNPFVVNLVQSVRVQFQDELIDLQSDVEFRTKCREYDLTSTEVVPFSAEVAADATDWALTQGHTPETQSASTLPLPQSVYKRADNCEWKNPDLTCIWMVPLLASWQQMLTDGALYSRTRFKNAGAGRAYSFFVQNN
ncbi:hypothetical protein ANN_12932 [Periplaneta americana]|uniref:Uncharacterized protein n=1 Tax=Periplaneta americana TaxID=6978 RepID=A0ABQ8TK53_PERAM|nr:hypothetical protein ANN_12932 [Periplaneta americana]